MKFFVPGYLQLLLLLSITAVTAQNAAGNPISVPLDLRTRASPRRVEPISDISSSRTGARADIGTKDAPVDGQDGKPHAGPFVEPLIDEPQTARPSLVKDQQLPEDGVMNDPNRKAPRKGTTGTEGGVTEKERQRQLDEVQSGQPSVKKPEPPKEALTAPVTDKTKQDAESGSSSGATKDPTNPKTDKIKPIGGIEKPSDLTERPHDIPHPAPHNTANQKDSDYPTPKNKYDDSDDDEIDGAHDIIPWDSLVGSFSSIVATEIGDKTFIVAALMAMRHPRFQVLTAAFSALFIMTILSGFAGHAIGAVISKRWSALLAALLFLVFGGKALKEGFDMDPDAGTGEEMREVQAELEEKEVDIARQEDSRHRRTSSISPYALESGRMGRSKSQKRSPSTSPTGAPRHSASGAVSGIKNLLGLVLSPAWVETFSMTFVGELGDRSQIATVAMAAGQEYTWVIVGATVGHFCCTALAVVGGSVLAGRVSMRKVTLIGGSIFIVFGFFTLLEAIQYWR